MTWEEAVEWYRNQPNNEKAILDNYFDKDPLTAARRFDKSREFKETLKFLPHKGSLLDIGAGRGTSSFAFAKHGYEVTALEPDKSQDVGAGAIKFISTQENTSIKVVEEFGELLPFSDAFFDIVHVRQALHHANDLKKFCFEASRVLKKGGTFIAIREHVLNKKEDLEYFLSSHPLHSLYQGENAFTLETYLSNLKNSGLIPVKIIKPFDSPINYYPSPDSQLIEQALSKMNLNKLLYDLIKKTAKLSSIVRKQVISSLNQKLTYPGIMYSFICKKV